ncbi:MAG: hypothetical protein HZC28_05410 [Spirochaetes bacterium]|nr:hypothetical protein [Spirochaetota bacterium]
MSMNLKHLILYAALAGTVMFPATMDSFDVLNIGAGGASAAFAQTVAGESGTIEGVFNNPATLGSLGGATAVLGSYNPYIEGMSLWSGAAAIRLPGLITLAVSGYGLMFDPIPGDIKFSGDTGRLMQSGDYVFGASAAFPLGSYGNLPFTLDLGITARYVMEMLDDVTISGVMADAGIILAFTNLAGNDMFSVGAYGRNLGIPLSQANEITLPMAVCAGVMYGAQVSPVFGYKALFDGTYYFNDTPKFNIGTEIGLFRTVMIRMGYMIGYDARGFTIGGGLNLGFSGMKVSFDYSLVPLGDLGMHHALQLTGMFGDVQVKIDPGKDLYEQGMAHENTKRYEEALATLAKITDGSAYYERARKSIEKLAVIVAARRAYGEGVGYAREGRLTDAVAAWSRVPQGSDVYEKAQKSIAKAKARIAEEAAAQAAPADMSDDDLYRNGIALAREKKLNEAIEMWSRVREGSEVYEKAQKAIERAKRMLAEE